MRKIAAHFILNLAILIAANISASANPDQVTINFDNLSSGIALPANQYPQATFYAQTDFTLNTVQDYPLGNGIFSRFNYCSPPTSTCAQGDVYIDFPIPVNNFSFRILGSVSPYHLFYVAVYTNGSYYGTFEQFGNGQPGVPLNYTALSSIPNITNIRIYYVINADPIGRQYNLYYDDFTFTPSFDANITSGRVSGILNGSTQKAMLGADVALSASFLPTSMTGGTYSWSVTGQSQQVSATNTSSSYTVRWTEPGTYQAKVTYTRNGFSATSTVNVNVVIPKLTSFTATQAADRIVANQCDPILPPPGTVYILGCPPSPWGIDFSASAQIPDGSYLTDLAQSGIKYVQITSSYQKKLTYGKVTCQTARSSEAARDTGWQRDGADPYIGSIVNSVVRFTQGGSLTTTEHDAPRIGLTTTSYMFDADAYYVNDLFEMYIVYFTGSNPSGPIFQRAIGIQNSTKPVARIGWSWGGQVVYDPASAYSYLQQFTLVSPKTYPAEAVDFMRPYSGLAQDLVDAQCPDGPPVYNNPIDGNRYFVRQQYLDILKRQPDGNWVGWIGGITQCGFDQACIDSHRLNVARGFYESPEFRSTHPLLQNPAAPEYNQEYVRQLYRTLLCREPDGNYQLWLNQLNQTGDYAGVINGFIGAPEYKNRFYPVYYECPGSPHQQ